MKHSLEQIVHSLDDHNILEHLEDLIEQTFKIEREYQGLKQDYQLLQSTVEGIIEAQPNALWIIDAQGTIFLQNSNARKLQELFVHLSIEEQEYERTFNDRSYLINVNQTPEKIIISATDITEQKRKESLATMGQMAAHLSHEIRNPIGSIALLTSTLLKRVKVENKPIVFEIQKAIFRIERIIEATLMFSKGAVAHKDSFLLHELSSALHTAVSYYSYTKAIRFDFSFPAIEIYADKELLDMVFSNFVFNAIDAIEEDEGEEGEVCIAYVDEGMFHRFEITDSGVPIAQPELLFQAFKSSKEKGNGLGLVLSEKIIACHNGDISVKKEGQKGFVIRLQKETS